MSDSDEEMFASLHCGSGNKRTNRRTIISQPPPVKQASQPTVMAEKKKKKKKRTAERQWGDSDSDSDYAAGSSSDDAVDAVSESWKTAGQPAAPKPVETRGAKSLNKQFEEARASPKPEEKYPEFQADEPKQKAIPGKTEKVEESSSSSSSAPRSSEIEAQPVYSTHPMYPKELKRLIAIGQLKGIATDALPEAHKWEKDHPKEMAAALAEWDSKSASEKDSYSRMQSAREREYNIQKSRELAKKERAEEEAAKKHKKPTMHSKFTPQYDDEDEDYTAALFKTPAKVAPQKAKGTTGTDEFIRKHKEKVEQLLTPPGSRSGTAKGKKDDTALAMIKKPEKTDPFNSQPVVPLGGAAAAPASTAHDATLRKPSAEPVALKADSRLNNGCQTESRKDR